MTQPLILVTNDDGIFSPGLAAAVEAVEPLDEVVIVAPRYQQTSMSRAISRNVGTGMINKEELRVGSRIYPAYAIHASPALAVSHAILEVVERKPDLCVSGINYGENVGLSTLVSGTVGAALEANSYDIPALAVSLEASLEMQRSPTSHVLDWQAAMFVTRCFAQQVLLTGLPPRVAALNLNIPSDATCETPHRWTSMSRQNSFVFERPPAQRNVLSSYSLSVKVEIDDSTLEKESDIYALIRDRVVSVTPLGWDLTARRADGSIVDLDDGREQDVCHHMREENMRQAEKTNL